MGVMRRNPGATSRDDKRGNRRVLVVGGFGYENVGDEGQAGASISRWRSCGVPVDVTVFTPNMDYTRQIHNVDVELAPRVVWFHANKSGYYFRGGWVFQALYALQYLRQTASAWCSRLGLPYLFSTPSEARILATLAAADILHFSGGGYLTGATRSRLWESCLLMRLCQILGIPYVLTGQTIGVFGGPVDRWLAKRGLRDAQYIGLRDQGISETALREIGVKGSHVKSTLDDALFCERANEELLYAHLVGQGVDPGRGYVALHFHEWGQSADMARRASARFVELAEHIHRRHGLQLVLIPMAPSDEAAQDRIVAMASVPIVRLRHGYCYQVAAGAFGKALFTLTFKHHPIIFSYGRGVPVVAVALDEYYYHKNYGAMNLCDQGKFCLTLSEFFGEQAFAACDAVLEDRDGLSRQIAMWLDKVIGLDREAQELVARDWSTRPS